MKLRTPLSIEQLFYAAINTNTPQDEEQFGLSIWRLYAGIYNNVLHVGLLDEEGCLPGFYC